MTGKKVEISPGKKEEKEKGSEGKIRKKIGNRFECKGGKEEKLAIGRKENRLRKS